MIRPTGSQPSFLGAVAAVLVLCAGTFAPLEASGQGSRSRSSVSRGGGSGSSGGSGSGSTVSSSSRSSRSVVSRSGSSADSRRSTRSQRDGSRAGRSSTGRAAVTRPSYGRGHHGGGRHHGRHYRPYYPHRYWSLGFYGYYPYTWWGSPYYGPYYHGRYRPVVYASRPAYDMGALDLKVRPKNAEVYVNGQYVGVARQYDGFPGHLWLERGYYEVAFVSPGFATETRDIEIFPGLVIDLDIRMEPGDSIRPTRVRPRAGYTEARPATGAVGAPAAPVDASVELRVYPPEASVYLDGRFAGTAEEVSSGAIEVAAGEHTLEVLHPGYRSETVRFVADPSRDARVDVRLDPLS